MITFTVAIDTDHIYGGNPHVIDGCIAIDRQISLMATV